MLVWIRAVHTALWGLVFTSIIYVLYCSIYQIQNHLVTVAIGIVLLEGLVLILNEGTCPLTNLAKRYSDNHELGFDIYLPQWILRRHKLILGTVFGVGLALNLIRNVSF